MKKRKFLLLILLFILLGCSKKDDKKYNKIVYFTFTDEEIADSIFEEGTKVETKDLKYPSVVYEKSYFEGWYLDAEFKIPFSEYTILEDTFLYANWVEYEEYKVLDSLKISETVTSNIDLTTEKGGFTIRWVSSNEKILNGDGVYTAPEKDTEVILTAEISSNGKIFIKEFQILVKAELYDTEFEAIFASIQIPEYAEADLILPVSFSNGISGSWHSSKTSLISSTGKVTLGREIEEVKLTLTLKKDIYSKTYEFIVKTISTYDYNYFVDSAIKKGVNVKEILMDKNAIADFNSTVLETEKTNTVNLLTIEKTIVGSKVKTLIETYDNINKYPVYNNETLAQLTTDEKQVILENRNISGINTEINVQYAVSIKHTNLRSYPTLAYSQSYDMDRFQETGFSVGVPMVVYHISKDQKWYFVRMYNYAGWASAADIAICSYEDFNIFVNPTQFIVVLDDKKEIYGQLVRMGYIFPYKEKSLDTYTLLFPTSDDEGKLFLKDVVITNDDSISDGYLDYTIENLLKQAFKFLDTPYSWGDKSVNGLDCSSTQAAIYASFGFKMGRNTSNQWATLNYGKSVSNLSNESVSKFQIGTLLYTSSHVLLYIGTDMNGKCWLLHNTNSGNICKVETFDSYGAYKVNNILDFQK